MDFVSSPVSDEYISTRRHTQSGGLAQHAGGLAHITADPPEKDSLRRENLHVTFFEVRNYDLVLTVYRHARRAQELAVLATLSAELAHELARVVEHLDTVVVCVRHQHQTL